MAAQNTADALTDQASKATTERQRLEQEAADRKAEAEQLQAEAVAEIAEKQTLTTQLTAQLASLDATAAALEQEYQKGKEEEDRRRAAEAAAAAEDDAPSSTWVPGSGEIMSPDEAKAYNDSSGAYGIPQSLPASKMSSAGADYVTNAMTQIRWGLTYIVGRYDTPCGALGFWNAQSPHWY